MLIQQTTDKINIAERAVAAGKYTVFLKALGHLAAFLGMVLLVRALSEHDYGIYKLFYSVISIMGMFASFGLANTLLRFLPEYYAKGEFRIANTLYRSASLIRLFTNVIILGLFLLLWEQLSPYLKISEYKNLFQLFTVVILLHIQRQLLTVCLDSYFLHKYTQGLSALFFIVKTIGYGMALLMHFNLLFVFCIDLGAYVLVFSCLQVIYFKKIPVETGHLKTIDPKERKRLFRYAFFYNFNEVGTGLLNPSFDNFIIVMFLNPIAVGAYAFSQSIAQMINRLLPLSYLSNVIEPAFFSLSFDEQPRRITQFFQIMVKINLIVSIPLLFFLATLGDEFIRVFFGGKFLEYAQVVTGIYFFSSFSSMMDPVGLVAQLRERSDIVLYSKIFALYNLAADVVLIYFFGIWGAVFATGTAVFGKNIFIWFFVRNEASFSGMGAFYLKSFSFWLVISLLAGGLTYSMANHLMALVSGTLIFLIAFMFQFRLLFFSTFELQTLSSLAGKNKKMNRFLRLLGVSK